MKLTNLLFAFILILGISSCKKDKTCTPDDWVGTYKNISNKGNCDGIATDDIVITKNGKILLIDGQKATASECTIVQSVEIFNHNVEMQATLDGDSLTLVATSKDEKGNVKGSCTSIFKRK